MRRIVLIAFVAVLALSVAFPAFAGSGSLSSDLSWENEVPPAIGTSATGMAHFSLDHRNEEICFEIRTRDLSGAILADHIHAGAAGVNGGVVVNLGGATEGCVDVDREVIAAIRSNPADYYLNIHTALNPAGEVRGQLSN